MNSTAVETIRSLLLSTSRAVVNLESNTLRIPRRLRMFTDADVPELQLLQAAYLLALVSYALVFNPLTELLFPFPGGGARARRMSVAIPLLAWASLVMGYLPFRLMADEPVEVVNDIYTRIVQERGRRQAGP